MALSDMAIQRVEPGGFLGRHKVLAQLGQGGMADVFLAAAPGPVGLTKLVVIKRLRDNCHDEEFAAMFLNEASIAARLNHPNVIHLYDVTQDEAELYLVMEYLDGQPLQRIRGQLGAESLALGVHLRILCDSLLGLHYAHELVDYDGSPLGIVHRDMSPQNIFVTYEGTTKVLDFGIAKALNQPVHTRVGGVKGKIQYMSPEQARGGSNIVDRRSDVFTMGVLLWEAAVGRRLWKGENESVIFQRLVRGDTIPTPRSANSLVHPRLDRICTRALSVDREKRYATAEELRLDVEDYMVQAGLRISSLDVGRFLSERFCREREAMRAMIDAELRNTSASLKVVTTSTRVGSTGRSVSSSINSQPPTALAPSAGPTRYWKHAALGLGGAILVALAFWGMTSRVPPAAPATSQIPVIPAPTSPVVPPVATQLMVNLSIDVVPASARVFLDDRLLGTGAFRGRVDRIPGAHRLRAEAPGHKSMTTDISLESDSTVQLALTPEVDGARSNKKAEHPTKPASASAPSEPQPASKRKPPVVSIDTENPW